MVRRNLRRYALLVLFMRKKFLDRVEAKTLEMRDAKHHDSGCSALTGDLGKAQEP